MKFTEAKLEQVIIYILGQEKNPYTPEKDST